MNLGNNRKDLPGEQSRENHLQVIAALGKIGANVEKILSHLEKQNQVKTELFAVNPGITYPFNANGYRFNSLLVGDSQATDSLQLVINVDGLTYTKSLSAGENEVNIPDGAQIQINTTSGNGAALVLSRYNINKV